MSIKYDKYMPLYTYLSPASIPQIVAHIQDYLVKHPILSVETIAEIIVQSLQEHPELINGTAIPISADSEQSIKAYIDSLPSIDTYTKAEINILLTGKQDTLTFDQAPTPGSSNPVTSSGIIAAISSVQSTLETLIEAKADSASTYTKSQVDTLLTDKANTDDVYSKNTMDAKLLEYATSDSVYSKTDINTIKQVNKANLAIVSSDGTAPLDIAAGQYVYMDDVMFMATEDILTGARLIPNTNIVLNPTGVTNRIGDGLKNAATQITGLAGRMTQAEEAISSQSQHIDKLNAALSGPDGIQENANLNDYIETKAWRIGNMNVKNGPDTALAGNYGTLYVRRNAGYISQFFVGNNGKFATRFCIYTNESQTWSEWNIYAVNTDVDKLKWKLGAKDSPNVTTYIPDVNWTELFILVRVGSSAQSFSFYYHKTNNIIRLNSGFPYEDGYCNCSITIQETTNAVIKETIVWYKTNRLAEALVTIYYK